MWSFLATLILLLSSGASYAQSPVEPNAEFGRYCGALKENVGAGRKWSHYNCKGSVWALNESALLITGFTFQPSFFQKENITFWAGPLEPSNQIVNDMFPSVNGFYLEATPIKNSEKLNITYQTAKIPNSDEVAQISRSREEKAKKDKANEQSLNDTPEPNVEPESPAKSEPIPTPEGRRKRRQIPANLRLIQGPPSPFQQQQPFQQPSFQANRRYSPPSRSVPFQAPSPPKAPEIDNTNFLAALLGAQQTQQQQQGQFAQSQLQALFGQQQPNVQGQYGPQQQSPTGYYNTFLQPQQAPEQDFLTAASHWWLPNLLKSAFQNVAPKQPIQLSLFDLKDLFRPATTTTTQATTQPIVATTTTATTTTVPSVNPSENLDAINNPQSGGGIKLIVDGGFVTLPPHTWATKTPGPLVTNRDLLGQVEPATIVTTKKASTTTTEVPSTTELAFNADEMPPLSWYAGLDPILLRLPEGKKVSDMRWLSVWDHTQKDAVASVLIPQGPRFAIPSPATIRGLKPTLSWKAVRSGPIEILDSKTIRIQDFYFEGDAPGAWFMAGKGVIPTPAGKILPKLNYDGSYDCEFLKPHYNETVTLKLPGDLEVGDVFWLSVFCVPYAISFAHVYLPYADLNVPPAIHQTPAPYCVLEDNV